ncbi:uncharacterized protein TrAFT101_011707 [Trichoderma asperellum]|uniref:uncharacterized protein n=1 Tax=Trichoderma asperellum TaxID=101201 RepID=UPI00332B8618|nr:hypothetical protein TrAFT101_011707 [Trichoderma asperellum]
MYNNAFFKSSTTTSSNPPTSQTLSSSQTKNNDPTSLLLYQTRVPPYYDCWSAKVPNFLGSTQKRKLGWYKSH